jgi:hypothetical protein
MENKEKVDIIYQRAFIQDIILLKPILAKDNKNCSLYINTSTIEDGILRIDLQK